MTDFRSLKVWEKAHRLTLRIYEITKCFPRDELYGLTSQIRRSCASVPTNIAEGCGRNTQGDLIRFMEIAMGSASEVEYQLFLAHDLGYLDEQVYEELAHDVTEVKRMLTAFIQTARRKRNASH